MPVVEINDLAKIGQINDVAAYMLPPEAWTFAENIRYERGAPTALSGWQQVFGTPPEPPHFALPFEGLSQTWWLYTSQTKAYAFDGSSYGEITRSAGGNYATTLTEDWNGLVFGGIPIFNNGQDVPQMWVGTPSLTLKLQALTAWPATMSAKILRSFGSYLVAFNIKDTTFTPQILPYLVQWSNPAGPGTLPTSWSYSSPITEGGRKDLPDVNAGEILEALQLGQTMFIYKERSVWKMSYIGGQYIFQFDMFLPDIGILAARCVCMDLTGTKHVVVTQDDIIIHNGNSTQSILTDRQKVTLFATLNRDAAHTSFLFLNKAKDEIWFCFPEAGQQQPSRALIWNAKNGVGAISYAPGITFRNAALGDIQGVNPEPWNPEGKPDENPASPVNPPTNPDTPLDTWDVENGPWSQIYRQKIVVSSPALGKFFQLDLGTTRDGADYSVVLTREDLGIIGRKSNGEPINDFKQMKMVDSVWPKLTGAPIRVRVGFRETVNGQLTWQDYTQFDPATDLWVSTIVNENLPGCGKTVSIEFSSAKAIPWKLDGYSINVEVIGPF
jgi:hypothetical protein